MTSILLAVIGILTAFLGLVIHRNKAGSLEAILQNEEQNKNLADLTDDIDDNKTALSKEEANRETIQKEEQKDVSIKELVDFINNNKSK